MKKLHTNVAGSRGWLTAALFAALLALLLLAPDALALKESRRQQVKEQINRVKTWEMTKELGLDDEQARIFFPAMEEYENERDQLKMERGEIESTLDSLLADGGPRADSEILKNLERLRLIERRQTAHEDEYQRKLGRILTPQQRARYELFERDFEARLRQMIREIQDEQPERQSRSEYETRRRTTDDGDRKVDRPKTDSSKTKTKTKSKSEDKKKNDKEKSDRKSKSRTGDKDKDESGKKKNSDERSSRGKGSSRGSGDGPRVLERRGEENRT